MRAARQGCRALQNVGTVRRAAQVCRPYERAGQFPVVTLIRPLRGHLSLLPLAFGHFPLTGGIGPLEGGRLSGDRKGRPYGFTGALPEIWRAGEDTRPYTDAEALSSIRRGRTLAGPQMCAARPGGRALQPSTSRHLLVKARRGTETASAPIFHHARAQWPGGNLDTHSDFHAPEILHIPTGTRPPVMGSGERRI